MSRFVICYDVADNKRRYKVAACLDGYGDRVQGSVFELRVERALLDRCLAQVSGLINAAEDSVVAYRLCAACEKERIYLGVGEQVAHIGEEDVFIA